MVVSRILSAGRLTLMSIMAAAQYRHTVTDLELPDLLVQADLIREATDQPGWQVVLDAIDAHKAKMLQRLLHEGTKPDDIPYLRGLIAGLDSMREAADSITRLAVERETEAKRHTAREMTHA